MFTADKVLTGPFSKSQMLHNSIIAGDKLDNSKSGLFLYELEHLQFTMFNTEKRLISEKVNLSAVN